MRLRDWRGHVVVNRIMLSKNGTLYAPLWLPAIGSLLERYSEVVALLLLWPLLLNRIKCNWPQLAIFDSKINYVAKTTITMLEVRVNCAPILQTLFVVICWWNQFWEPGRGGILNFAESFNLKSDCLWVDTSICILFVTDKQHFQLAHNLM